MKTNERSEMSKPRDTYGSKHFGRTYGMTLDPELEGEECIECGEQATVVYEDREGLIHYCDKHDPEHH